MTTPFYFSDFIKPVGNNIRFFLVVLGRFFRICFRYNKQLNSLELEYPKKYQFDQSLLIIRYRCHNALWYHFKGIKRTTKDGVMILNLMKVPEMPVILTVYGFCRKKAYSIDTPPETKLQTRSFQTSIHKLGNLHSNLNAVTISPLLIKPDIPKIHVHCDATRKSSLNIQLVHTSFNQTEFI